MCGLTRPSRPAAARGTGHDGPRGLTGETTTPIAQEQRPTADRLDMAALEEAGARALEPGHEPIEGHLADRDQSLLVALADDPDERTVEREILAVEPDRLADPQAGGIQQLEQRPIADPTLRRSLQQAFHLADIERVRQASALTGQVEVRRDVHVDEALTEGEAVEALERGRAPTQARRGQAGLAATTTLRPVGEIAHGRVGGPGPRGVIAKGPPEVPQIAAVCLDGRRRQPAFHVQVGQVVLDGPIE